MATITAQNVIDKAEIIIQDTTNIRHPASELLGWFNDGQREVVLLKPDANPQNESIELAAGTKQSIPATGTTLIDVIRNMSGASGTVAGNVVRRTQREILDDQNEDWHSEAGNAVTNHYVFDPRDPKHFYVYPPSLGTNHLEIVYAEAPADIVIGATMTLDDIYANALLDYILYRAYSKDASYAGNAARAASAYASFRASLGFGNAVEAINDPNVPAQVRSKAEMS